VVSAARAALVLASVAALAYACRPPGEEAIEAPKVERHPPPHTSDGRVVGADDKSPERSLAEQPTTSGPATGWKLEPDGVSYDPKRSTGEDKGSTRITPPDAGADAASH
jgi:hypothetical protein